ITNNVNTYSVNDDSVSNHSVNDDSVNDDSVNDDSVSNHSVNNDSINNNSVNNNSVNNDFIVVSYENENTISKEHEYKSKNKKQTNAITTKYINCKWHINLSQLVKNNTYKNIYIITLENKYNHDLSYDRVLFFNDNKFTKEMVEQVEFYMNIIKLKLLQIQKAIKKEFSHCEIYLLEVYKVVIKFYNKRQKDISNDAVLLYEDLLKKKDNDPNWYIAVD
ncbi:30333_t:CDS:2, partial [Racocetra persica]